MDTINTIVTNIFAGGPESIIAILLLIIAAMSWFVFNSLKERQKILSEQNELSEKYNNKLIEVIEKSHQSHSLTTSAINEIRIVLAEIKARQ